MKRLRLKLAQYLDERKISRYALAKMTGIQYQIIDGYYKNKPLRYDVYNLSKIITALNCGVGDPWEGGERDDP